MQNCQMSETKFVLHIWKAMQQETRCGLWFKAVPALKKPNLVSVVVAMKIDANGLGGILCKNCVKTVQSANPRLLRESTTKGE